MRRGASERPEDEATGGVEPTTRMPTLRTAHKQATARHAAVGTASPRRASYGAAHPKPTGAPRTTRAVPAIDRTTLKVPALPPTHERGGVSEHTGLRRITQAARPIRPEDTALVEKTTQVLRAIQIVEPVEALPALLEPEDVERGPVTVVPRTQEVPVVWTPQPPLPQRHRSLRSRAVFWALAVLVVAGVITAISPLARGAFMQPSAPRGVRIAANQNAGAPSGPWASMSGAADVLGIGGGAGPGVNAPGSAGLPVSKTKSRATPTPKPVAPAASSAGGISSPPVQPWPPANAYMAVPGRPAFAVSPNGFYSWAFGQCTWWAQYKRQDENLTYMGNAQYWASGAAARGYHVGTVPVAGATVVFQPGVQGAGGAGHVAHVEAVYPDGWFLVSEMNFYWNGGGWGRVDYRFAHAGGGVQFIY